MSEDVAGATLIAAATSFPVLFSSVITTFVFVSNAGVDVVVGTCVYNLLVCVAITALLYGYRLRGLSKIALGRDVGFHIVSLSVLFLFLLDDAIVLYEAILLNLVYIIYCGVTVWLSRLVKSVPLPEPADTEKQADEGIDHGISMAQTVASESALPDASPLPKRHPWLRDPLGFIIDKSFPLHRYWLAAIVAIVYLFVLTYLMMDSVARLGTIVGIPDRVVTLVLIPIAANLPSTIGGVISAKSESSADMAVSSSFGSNIFSVLVGMGLPWLLRIAAGSPVQLDGVSRLLPNYSILLGVHIFVFFAILLLSRFKLSKATGVALAFCFLAYIILVILDVV